MALAPNTRIGPYEVKSPLGEGGMGVVYRATDVKLQRDVALKLLPDHFAADPDRLARFQREAQVLASLNHPNIAHIYGLEESGTSRCIVMELVEGETLQQRVTRGAIPVEEALQIAKQIAEALEAAHERGIIHRDLKPGNIMLTTDSNVKVLDFGLAKAMQEQQPTNLSNSPTMVSPASMPGVILGTAAYMSPEQARGHNTDHRSDIFAFGCVLYEMLSGQPAFTGRTVSDILASVIKEEPKLADLPSAVPPRVKHLLQRCLAKDVKSRLQAIGDLQIFLQDFPEDSNGQSWRLRKSYVLLTAVVATLLIAAAAGVMQMQRPLDEEVIKLSLAPPENTTFDSIAVSPDGRQIAFTAKDSSGKIRLWVRSLSGFAAKSFDGTDDAALPFWSPDSRFIAFNAEGKLKKIEAAGGSVQTICESVADRGGTWGSKGIIIFAPGSENPLMKVNVAGGKPEPITNFDPAKDEASHRWPFFLPDGQHFLFAIRSGQPTVAGVYIADLATGTRSRLLPEVSNAMYASSKAGLGRLLFVRGTALMSQPFDPGKLELVGEPSLVVDKIGFSPGFSHGAYSVSQTGVLVFNEFLPSENTQLSWFDRLGNFQGFVGEPGSCNGHRLSPDNTRLSYGCINPQTGYRDLWVRDLRRDVATKIGLGESPVWSPDGKRIVFAPALLRTGDADKADIVEREANGGGFEAILLKSGGIASSWSSDSRFLLFRKLRSLWVAPFSNGKAGQPFSFRNSASPTAFANFELAGNSKWVAYQSSESGRNEIYVEAFTPEEVSNANRERWQVSKNGGTQPKWRGDGRELFYLSHVDKKVMAVEMIDNGKAIVPGAPQPLFPAEISNVLATGFDVTTDGQRFLIQVLSAADASPASVIVNWPGSLRR